MDITYFAPGLLLVIFHGAEDIIDCFVEIRAHMPRNLGSYVPIVQFLGPPAQDTINRRIYRVCRPLRTETSSFMRLHQGIIIFGNKIIGSTGKL